VWDSGESSEDMLKSHEDVFKDLLRVKKLSQRISSVESKKTWRKKCRIEVYFVNYLKNEEDERSIKS
jgi:hypothetical protein